MSNERRIQCTTKSAPVFNQRKVHCEMGFNLRVCQNIYYYSFCQYRRDSLNFVTTTTSTCSITKKNIRFDFGGGLKIRYVRYKHLTNKQLKYNSLDVYHMKCNFPEPFKSIQPFMSYKKIKTDFFQKRFKKRWSGSKKSVFSGKKCAKSPFLQKV